MAEIFARCGSGSGSWITDVKQLENGEIVIYMDKGTGEVLKLETVGRPGRVQIPLTKNQDSRIRIAFYPKHAPSASRARIKIQADGVDSQIDGCMSVKTCLEMLGDGSDASFKLRNLNERQLDCLENRPMPTELRTQCEKWHGCIAKSDQAHGLLALLRASIRPMTMAFGGKETTPDGGGQRPLTTNRKPKEAAKEAWMHKAGTRPWLSKTPAAGHRCTPKQSPKQSADTVTIFTFPRLGR